MLPIYEMCFQALLSPKSHLFKTVLVMEILPHFPQQTSLKGKFLGKSLQEAPSCLLWGQFGSLLSLVSGVPAQGCDLHSPMEEG